MEVTVIVNYIQLLMYDLYLLKYSPTCRPDYISNHILIDHLQIRPDGDVEIDCPSELVEIIPAESVDDVCEGRTHIQQVEKLIGSSFAFAIAHPMVVADARIGSLLEV